MIVTAYGVISAKFTEHMYVHKIRIIPEPRRSASRSEAGTSRTQ